VIGRLCPPITPKEKIYCKPSKNTDMIQIDGSIGEGGGQVLRTALTLAA
jgi:hypothetical protein